MKRLTVALVATLTLLAAQNVWACDRGEDTGIVADTTTATPAPVPLSFNTAQWLLPANRFTDLQRPVARIESETPLRHSTFRANVAHPLYTVDVKSSDWLLPKPRDQEDRRNSYELPRIRDHGASPTGFAIG